MCDALMPGIGMDLTNPQFIFTRVNLVEGAPYFSPPPADSIKLLSTCMTLGGMGPSWHASRICHGKPHSLSQTGGLCVQMLPDDNDARRVGRQLPPERQEKDSWSSLRKPRLRSSDRNRTSPFRTTNCGITKTARPGRYLTTLQIKAWIRRNND